MASRKRIFKCIAVLIALIAAVCFGSAAKALADSRYDYENPDTGYCVKIIDGSDLMSDEDEELLAEHMKMMTEYGNAVFYLLENNPLTAEEASGNKYNALFGEENGVLFLIDYENEQIYLKNNGDFAYWLEPGTSNSILSDALDNLGDGGDVDLAIDVFDQYFEAIDSSDRQYHYEASTGEDGFTDESVTEEESSEKVSKKNSETGYEAFILDEADLLTDSEENRLFEEMMPITEYANCVFYSSNVSSGEPEQAVRSKYLDIYGSNSVNGVLFFVDMKNRQLVLCGAGNDITSVVTSSKCDSIMDNVYRYASNGDYYNCAAESYREAYTLLDGGKINEPMRVTSNAFLAIIFGMLLAYGIVRRFSTVSRPSEKELLAAISARQQLNNYKMTFVRQTRRYDPPSSSSSGGGGGGGGVGGGGGGSFSSGSHGF